MQAVSPHDVQVAAQAVVIAPTWQFPQLTEHDPLSMIHGCRPLGFPRSVRMTDAKQFEAVFRRPEFKKHSGALRIRARANRMHGARLGLVIAKRQVAKANDRNRLKRVCRETFRLRHQQLPAVDIVVQVMVNQGNRQLAVTLSSILEEVSTYFISNPGKIGLSQAEPVKK